MNETQAECICGDAKADHAQGNKCTVCPCKSYRPACLRSRADAHWCETHADNMSELESVCQRVLFQSFRAGGLA